MARKVKHPEHANHERWLVSYADFITLLFAFFVVMFATSHADKDKQKVVSAAVKDAINEGTFVTAVAGFLGKSKDNQDIHLREAKPYEGAPTEPKKPEKKDEKEPPKEKPNAAQAAVVELLPSFQALSSDLQKEIADGKLDVSLEPRGLVVSMKEAAFFPAASDAINREAYPIIAKVADSIRKLKNPVRLEGHTDAIPIRSKRFPNNWSLAAARSIAMLELLEKKFDVNRGNMAVSGYADTVPIGDNETAAGRAKNRRVDIIILNQFGLASEPEKVKQAQQLAVEKGKAKEESKAAAVAAPTKAPAAPTKALAVPAKAPATPAKAMAVAAPAKVEKVPAVPEKPPVERVVKKGAAAVRGKFIPSRLVLPPEKPIGAPKATLRGRIPKNPKPPDPKPSAAGPLKAKVAAKLSPAP